MNGTKFSYDKMVWCTNPNGKIDYLEGSMFFGGSTQDWANPHDTYVLIEKCQLVTVV